MKTWAMMVKGDAGWEFVGFTHNEDDATDFVHHYKGSAFKYMCILIEDES